MRMSLHFAPIIITSRLEKVQIYPVLWHWTFAAEKLVFIQKHKKKANTTLSVHQFDRK
jgi:hypothetical protein